jgi:hypothetical protein
MKLFKKHFLTVNGVVFALLVIVILFFYQNCGSSNSSQMSLSSRTIPTYKNPPTKNGGEPFVPPSTSPPSTSPPSTSPPSTSPPSTPPPSTPPPSTPTEAHTDLCTPTDFTPQESAEVLDVRVTYYDQVRMALHCMPIEWQEDSPMWGNRGTANFRMMFVSAHYLHSVRFGTTAQKAKARTRMMQLLQTQEQNGHMVIAGANEQFVLDPHANFWNASMVAATWAAWDSNDAVMKQLCNKWWAIHFYWLKQGWNGLEVRLPGTRFKGNTPFWGADTNAFKLAHGTVFRPQANVWGSVIFLDKLLKRYPAALPTESQYIAGRLLMPIHVRVNGTKRTIWMDRPSELPMFPLDWVQFDVINKNIFTFGRDWETSIPY